MVGKNPGLKCKVRGLSLDFNYLYFISVLRVDCVILKSKACEKAIRVLESNRIMSWKDITAH